jgi:hypothetical protein
MPRFAPVIKTVVFSMFISFSFDRRPSLAITHRRPGRICPNKKILLYSISVSPSRTSVLTSVCLSMNWSQAVCKDTVGETRDV